MSSPLTGNLAASFRAGGSAEPAAVLGAGTPTAAAPLAPTKGHPPPNPDDQRTHLVASIFANVELDSTKKTLRQYMQKYEDAAKQNDALVAQMEERDRDALQVTDFLRKDVAEKQATIASLKKELETVTATMGQRLEAEQATRRDMQRMKDDIINKCEADVAALQKELEAVALYRRERQEVNYFMNQQKQQLEDLVAKHEREISVIQFQALEEKVQLRAERKDLLEQFQAAVDKRAMLLVSGKSKTIYDENKALADDKALLESELQTLTAERQQQLGQLSINNRELLLTQQSVSQFAKKGCDQRKQIKNLETSVRTLEAQLSAAKEAHDKDAIHAKQQRVADMADLRAKLAASEATVQRLQQELRHVKRLAGTVVKRRGEMETFFYEAFDHVKAQMAHEAQLQMEQQRLQLGSRDGVGTAPTAVFRGGTARSGGLGTAGGSRVTTASEWGASGKRRPSLPLASLVPQRPSPRASAGAPLTARDGVYMARQGASSGRGRGPPLSARSAPSHPTRPPPRPIDVSASATPTGALVPSEVGDPEEPRVLGTAGSQRSSHHGSMGTPGMAMEQDVFAMGWAEKERVLRLLFARINAAAGGRGSASTRCSSVHSIPVPRPGAGGMPRPGGGEYEIVSPTAEDEAYDPFGPEDQGSTPRAEHGGGLPPPHPRRPRREDEVNDPFPTPAGVDRGDSLATTPEIDETMDP